MKKCKPKGKKESHEKPRKATNRTIPRESLYKFENAPIAIKGLAPPYF
jgi:hypothetical protein